MNIKRYGLALAVGLLGISTVAYAAGLWPDYPVVGGTSYCAGTSNSATGTIIGAQTGCPNTVPAGPSVLTGNEQFPADTRLGGGASPQTVLVPMAAINALPLQVVSVTSASPAGISATNTSGGVVYMATSTITAANVTLPLGAIDGQQYVIAADHTITTLAVSAPAGDTLAVTTPTVLTASTTVPQGYTFFYNLATKKWVKLR